VVLPDPERLLGKTHGDFITMQPKCRLPLFPVARLVRVALPAVIAATPLIALAQGAPAVSTVLAFSASQTNSEVTLVGNDRLFGTALTSTSTIGGLVYSTTLDGLVVETVHQMGERDGARPEGGLVLGSDGILYGTTVLGVNRSDSSGTVFRVSPADGSYETLFEFAKPASVDEAGTVFNSNGAYPGAALIEGSDGNLYGTTRSGGENGAGTVFRIGRDGTGFKVLHEFAAFVQNEVTLKFTNADGFSPQSALLEGADGYFYGTAFGGGPTGAGTIFRLRFDGTAFEVIHEFSETVVNDGNLLPVNAEGAAPLAALIDGGDGFFYGAASQGGEFGHGTLYAIAPDGSVITVLHAFASVDGERPTAALTVGDDGRLYGTTYSGGTVDEATVGFGTVFSIWRDGTGFSSLFTFAGANGANPTSKLLQLSDDVFVGTVENGSACSQGAVFRLSLSGETIEGRTDCGKKKKKGGGGTTGLGLICLLSTAGVVRRYRRYVIDR
jgi:uncharacterized repeat protein (TIGR03803 family)